MTKYLRPTYIIPVGYSALAAWIAAMTFCSWLFSPGAGLFSGPPSWFFFRTGYFFIAAAAAAAFISPATLAISIIVSLAHKKKYPQETWRYRNTPMLVSCLVQIPLAAALLFAVYANMN